MLFIDHCSLFTDFFIQRMLFCRNLTKSCMSKFKNIQNPFYFALLKTNLVSNCFSCVRIYRIHISRVFSKFWKLSSYEHRSLSCQNFVVKKILRWTCGFFARSRQYWPSKENHICQFFFLEKNTNFVLYQHNWLPFLIKLVLVGSVEMFDVKPFPN